MDLRKIIRFFVSNLPMILTFMLVFGSAGVIYTYTLEPKYRASTEIYIEGDTGIGFNPLAAFTGAVAEIKLLNSEINVIESNKIMGKVVDNLGLMEDPDFNPTLREPSTLGLYYKRFRLAIRDTIFNVLGKEPKEKKKMSDEELRFRVIDIVTGSLRADIIHRTLIIALSFEASDPLKAATIVKAIADTYIQDRLDVRNETTEQALKYLNERLPELERDVEISEREVARFRTAEGVMSDTAVGATSEALAASIEQKRRLQERYLDAQAIIARYGDRVTDKESADAVLRLVSFEGRVSNAAAAIRAANRELSSLNASVSGHDARLKSLQETIDDLRNRFETQSSKAIRMTQLQRESEANSLVYENFLHRQKEVSQRAEVKEKDARIISDPRPPQRPFYPRKASIVGVFLFAGILLALMIAMLREIYLSPIRNVDDVQSVTGFRAMTTTPHVRSKVKPGPEGDGDKRKARIMHSIRDMRSLLALNKTEGRGSMTMITSSVPGEGKSTTSMLLAEACVGADQKTVLVDCDVWRRTLSKNMEGDRAREDGYVGFAQVMRGSSTLEEAIEVDTLIPGVHLLPAGAEDTFASDMLVDHRFPALIEQLREHYDAIIVDCPPMIQGSDAKAVSRIADDVVYLVRANHTRRAVVRFHVHDIATLASRKLHVVLTHSRGNQGYGYGYSYGYAYGASG